jgi:hypothetical protein
LKKLLRETPVGEAFTAVIAELDSDGPRGAAILGGATVESKLEDLLLSRMVELGKTEFNELFRNAGPLASFSAKIRAGYALGLFGEATRDNLDTLREVRNAFAHAKLVVTFETPEVVAVCKRFKPVDFTRLPRAKPT